jgi:cysteine desulfurase / selenocysteine lyase
MFNKKDFPLLQKSINGKPIIYLDSAATAQKPQIVIDAELNFYTDHNANVHRAVYGLGEQATTLYEAARTKVAQFIHAQHVNEIIFTRSTTEGINFVAATWAQEHVVSGDEIVISGLEHHSNLIPWQQLAHKKGIQLRYLPVNADGTLNLEHIDTIITKKTKLVAIAQVSNSVGTHNDMRAIVRAAKFVGAKVLIDAAQSAPHRLVNVQELGCDFLAFSGHKMMGPTGIGVLYIRKELHDQMSPYQFGGGMVFEAGLHKSSFLPAPYKFEAGTPPIAQAVGLGAAIDYLTTFTPEELQEHSATLCRKLIERLGEIPEIDVLGPIDQLKQKGHLVSFVLKGHHPHDIAAYLSSGGICVRAGHHCAQPLARRLGLESSVRVSFYGYNSAAEVDMLVEALHGFIAQF